MIPPHILEKINPDAAAKSQMIRRKRTMAPVPVPHAEGEDRKVYDTKNGTNLPGKEVQKEGDEVDPDQAVNEAYDGAGDTYKLYLDAYGRKSLDDKNMSLISTVHYDKNFDNAFWNGEQMVYGDGSFFNPFTRDLTVEGHELSHAVTQYTCNLDYQDQPGALNEHFSDVMGALVEQYAYGQTADKATWLIGALLCEGKIKGRALRDMLNPGTAYDDPVIGKDPQGADMAHYDHSSQDNGGVHINSGIPNRAFTLACLERGGNAWETIGKVWYVTHTTRVKSNTLFQGYADLTSAVAGELFGEGSQEQLAVQHGWAAVGITIGAPQPQPQPNPSPCQAALTEILGDPAMVAKLVDLGQDVRIRRFVARVHQALK